MSMIGGPISAGVAGAPEAQNRSNAAQSKRRADETAGRKRFRDEVELRVSQVEADEAVHAVDEHATDDSESDRHRNANPNPPQWQGPAHPAALGAYHQQAGQHEHYLPAGPTADEPEPEESPASITSEESSGAEEQPRPRLDLTG